MVRMVMSTDTLLSLLWSRSVSWLRTMRLFAGDHYRSSLMLRKMQETRVGIFMSQKGDSLCRHFFSTFKCSTVWVFLIQAKVKAFHFGRTAAITCFKAGDMSDWVDAFANVVPPLLSRSSSASWRTATTSSPGVVPTARAVALAAAYHAQRQPPRASALVPQCSVCTATAQRCPPCPWGGCPPPLPSMQGLTLSL